MPLYTFYPCKADGTSTSFVTCELPDDQAAHIHAMRVLDEHQSAAEVTVWDGDRRVAAKARVHPDLHRLLTRPRASDRGPPS